MYFWIGLAVVIGLYRPFLLFHTPNKHILESYKAFAHLLVGGLIVSAMYTENVFETQKVIAAILLSIVSLAHDFKEVPCWQFVTVSVLSWVEIICAVLSVKLKKGA